MSAKILVVDDEDTVCAALRELLEMRGYTVFEASNGVAGLKMCAEVDPDVLILDLNMPRMDGYLVMERLKERVQSQPGKARMPKVIVMTAVDKNTDFGLAENLGASKFMNKPFKSKELIATLEELLA